MRYIFMVLLLVGSVFAQDHGTTECDPLKNLCFDPNGVTTIKPENIMDIRPLTWVNSQMQIVMTCSKTEYDKDIPYRVKKVSGCYIADGHTFDEVAQGMVEVYQRQIDEREEIRNTCLGELKTVDDILKGKKSVGSK